MQDFIPHCNSQETGGQCLLHFVLDKSKLEQAEGGKLGMGGY